MAASCSRDLSKRKQFKQRAKMEYKTRGCRSPRPLCGLGQPVELAAAAFPLARFLVERPEDRARQERAPLVGPILLDLMGRHHQTALADALGNAR